MRMNNNSNDPLRSGAIFGFKNSFQPPTSSSKSAVEDLSLSTSKIREMFDGVYRSTPIPKIPVDQKQTSKANVDPLPPPQSNDFSSFQSVFKTSFRPSTMPTSFPLPPEQPKTVTKPSFEESPDFFTESTNHKHTEANEPEKTSHAQIPAESNFQDAFGEFNYTLSPKPTFSMIDPISAIHTYTKQHPVVNDYTATPYNHHSGKFPSSDQSPELSFQIANLLNRSNKAPTKPLSPQILHTPTVVTSYSPLTSIYSRSEQNGFKPHMANGTFDPQPSVSFQQQTTSLVTQSLPLQATVMESTRLNLNSMNIEEIDQAILSLKQDLMLMLPLDHHHPRKKDTNVDAFLKGRDLNTVLEKLKEEAGLVFSGGRRRRSQKNGIHDVHHGTESIHASVVTESVLMNETPNHHKTNIIKKRVTPKLVQDETKVAPSHSVEKSMHERQSMHADFNPILESFQIPSSFVQSNFAIRPSTLHASDQNAETNDVQQDTPLNMEEAAAETAAVGGGKKRNEFIKASKNHKPREKPLEKSREANGKDDKTKQAGIRKQTLAAPQSTLESNFASRNKGGGGVGGGGKNDTDTIRKSSSKSKQVDRRIWSKLECEALFNAHAETDPHDPRFWAIVSAKLARKGFDRTYGECRVQWFQVCTNNK
jgi:hypothetical protein